MIDRLTDTPYTLTANVGMWVNPDDLQQPDSPASIEQRTRWLCSDNHPELIHIALTTKAPAIPFLTISRQTVEGALLDGPDRITNVGDTYLRQLDSQTFGCRCLSIAVFGNRMRDHIEVLFPAQTIESFLMKAAELFPPKDDAMGHFSTVEEFLGLLDGGRQSTGEQQ